MCLQRVNVWFQQHLLCKLQCKIYIYGRDANLLRKKKEFWGWKKSIFEDEKKVFLRMKKKYFGLKKSIFHFVSIEVYTTWSLKKKRGIWGILLKITSICNLKKVLNTAKKEHLASLIWVLLWNHDSRYITKAFSLWRLSPRSSLLSIFNQMRILGLIG